MSGSQLQYALPLGTRADSLSFLQGLDRSLTRVEDTVAPLPENNPVPSQLDMSLVVRNTRVKKSCKGPLPIDRIESEAYPIDAAYLRDLRDKRGVFGAASRYDGRDPIAYRR